MCYILSLYPRDGSHTRSLPYTAHFASLPLPIKWLLSPCFPSWTHHETRVFTTGSLNNIPSPSPNSKMTTFGATTPRPCASRNFSLTILISSLARLHRPNGMQTVTVTHSMTHLYCLRLSRSCVTRRRTTLTSKTRLMAFFAK